MKSVLLWLVLMLFLPAAAAAAAPAGDGSRFPSRGTRLAGGSFSFSSAGDTHYENSAGDRTQEWSLRPGGGYFVADGWALDLHVEGRWFSQGPVWSSQYNLGPVLEYYFDVVGDDHPRGHAVPYLGLGYLWGHAREENPLGDRKFNSGLWSISGGLSWLLSDVVATDLEINYRRGVFTEKVPLDGLQRDADRISFFLGIKAFLP